MSDPRSQRAECPDLETLAAYIDKRLSASEHAAVEAHLADCETCREVLADTVKAIEEDEQAPVAPQPVKPVKWRAAVWWAAAAATLALAVGGAWWFSPSQRIGRAVQVLASVERPTRFSPGRLSIDQSWARGPAVTRGATQGGLEPRTREAVSRIEALTANRQTAAALRARGLALLVTGDSDGAIAHLRSSLELEDTADTAADLSAALLHRFERAGASDDLSTALAMANRALAASPELLPALFTRAVGVDLSGNRADVIAAWQAYLRRDATSRWAEEARDRLARAQARPPQSHLLVRPHRPIG